MESFFENDESPFVASSTPSGFAIKIKLKLKFSISEKTLSSIIVQSKSVGKRSCAAEDYAYEKASAREERDGGDHKRYLICRRRSHSQTGDVCDRRARILVTRKKICRQYKYDQLKGNSQNTFKKP